MNEGEEDACMAGVCCVVLYVGEEDWVGGWVGSIRHGLTPTKEAKP